MNSSFKIDKSMIDISEVLGFYFIMIRSLMKNNRACEMVWKIEVEVIIESGPLKL